MLTGNITIDFMHNLTQLSFKTSTDRDKGIVKLPSYHLLDAGKHSKFNEIKKRIGS